MWLPSLSLDNKVIVRGYQAAQRPAKVQPGRFDPLLKPGIEREPALVDDSDQCIVGRVILPGVADHGVFDLQGACFAGIDGRTGTDIAQADLFGFHFYHLASLSPSPSR